MIIGIDFDGTCVTHEFPNIGEDIGAVPILQKIIEAGHSLVLFTMRSDIKEVITDDPDIIKQSGNYLTDAQNWFIQNNISLWGINVNPEQWRWTTSPKAYCELYIDDAALGCPLKYIDMSKRPFVDWNIVEQWLKLRGII